MFSGYVDENGMDMLQFTAAISSGSSGGALFNDAGEVLGITFASYEAGQNLNLAVPIKYVEQLFLKTETSDKIALEEFCVTHIPTYSVDQVIRLGDKLIGSVFYVEGYIHSHGIVYRENGSDWESIWCNVYATARNGICTGESVQISYTVAPSERMPFELIVNIARLEELNSGEKARFRCEYILDAHNLALIGVEYVE